MLVIGCIVVFILIGRLLCRDVRVFTASILGVVGRFNQERFPEQSLTHVPEQFPEQFPSAESSYPRSGAVGQVG